MNLINAVRFYINKMCDESGPGMKVLLMDQETKGFVSVAFSQSEIAAKEVYLFDLLENMNREPMQSLKCLCFLRPTKQNISNFIREIKEPKYGQYYLYFTNIIEKIDLKSIAENDEQEVVRETQEYFADFLPINQHVFSFNIEKSYNGNKWSETTMKRVAIGITSVLLSLRKSPVIRYQNSSMMAQKLAELVRGIISRDSNLFNFRQNDNAPILLVLDRREDPLTPILNQWTYQAMVHELVGIKNNIVNLNHITTISKELEEIVLSSEYDDFYEKNMYSNFGEICSSIKELMEEFQKCSRNQAKVESIADMKAFVENYPQFKKMSGTVTKHVTLVSELSKLVSSSNLMEVSETEQFIATQDDHAEALQKIKKLIRDQKVKNIDILRLISLYALRYENNSNNELRALRELFSKRLNLAGNEIEFLNKLIPFGGQKVRDNDLFGNQNPIAITKRIIKGLKGVENVYTQHQPLVKQLLDSIIKGKLKESSYPYVGIHGLKEKPQEIIVFMIGGITYEEAYAVQNLNKNSNGNYKIIIGGTCIHNFKSYINEVVSFENSI